MPESMFGRPSQHLLPSHPPASGASALPSDPHTAPVQQAPLTFKDFRFNSIGKQPELLSRISLPQPDHVDYHSPTPSPTPSPPPPFANDSTFQPKSSSRPTLLQQLAGSDFGRWHASTSQSNGSLASRIQMSGSPSNDIANTAHGATSRFPSPPLRFTAARRVTDDASLIPPVEVLTQLPDSAPPTPASWAPTLEPVDVHNPASSTPLVNTTTITTSEIPAHPTVTTHTASREPTEPFASFAVVDAVMRGLQPSPSTPTALGSLVTRQERLQSISAKLANLASPLPPPSSQSQSQSPLDPSSVARANDNITLNQSNQSQHGSTPIVLRHPYSANQPSGRLGLSINDTPMHTDDPSLALVPSPTTLVQEHQTQRRAIIEAIQNLHSVLNVAQRAQFDNENALALRTRTFEEQRAAFEQTKRAEEATLQQQFQELQQKREELTAKEALLALLEKESKAREEARKGVLAKRQAQEEEKRASEAKRVHGVQEQIAIAMNELKEIEALKAKCQLEQLASETVPDDLPTEPQEGMGEEETTVIKSRNDLLCAVKHLRRMHTDKVRKLEESNRTLRRLEEERKKREGEEAERRRIAEEERLRAHADMQRALQVLDERRRQIEADRNRQEVENDREQPRLSVEQQTHADAQVHGVGRTEATSDQTLQYPSHEEVSASRQQSIADTKIRAAREETSLSPGNTTNVDEDGTGCAPRAVVLSDIHTSPGGSQSTTSQSNQKKAKPISGGVMLAAPTPKASGGHLPPKLLAISPSLSSSDPMAKNSLNSARTSPAIPVSAEGEHRSSVPAQLASRLNRAVNADIRPTPDLKPAFSRTPKSQTVLEATNGGSQELNIGPVSGVSPAQQNVNLRHLKRFRGRVEGNDNGDRSVRTINVKSEDTSYLSLKREEHDDQPRGLVQASLSTSLPASLPPRPAIIPPPRPRMPKKRHQVPASQTDSTSSYPPESNELSLTRKGKADVTTHEQPREVLSPDTPSSQAMNPPVQLPVPPEAMNSLLLGPVYAEPQATESHINAGERPTQDRGENYDTASSEPASATLELDGEDPPRSNKRFSRNATGSRRMSDHYSPPLVTSRSAVTSPTQPHRPIDSWRPQNPSNGARAEPMRATSPTTGRKRPSEFNDNEHGHWARKRRGDVWVAQDHDRVDSYRPHRDRRLDSEPDERRAVHRTAASPPDRFQSYPSDVSGTTYDNRTYPYVPLSPDWDPFRRKGNDDTYQWNQPSAPGYNTMTDQHHADDAGVGWTYEPMTEERMDVQPDPSLLARMHDTQRFLVIVVRHYQKIFLANV